MSNESIPFSVQEALALARDSGLADLDDAADTTATIEIFFDNADEDTGELPSAWLRANPDRYQEALDAAANLTGG